MKKNGIVLLLLLSLFLLVSFLVIRFHPNTRIWVEWQISKIQATVKYAIRPPEKIIFSPEDVKNTPIDPKVQITQSTTPEIIQKEEEENSFPTQYTLTPITTPTPTASLLATESTIVEPTPLPISVELKGVRYEDQSNRWSYCAPANLSMLLSYWGWKGNRDIVGSFVKPYEKDKNVMLYEMQSFVEEKTDLNSLYRISGNLNLIKTFISQKIPVLVERGVFQRDANGVQTWMGHYQVITGYNEQKEFFIAQDSFKGYNLLVPYEEFEIGWQSFNYAYFVVYSKDRESDVYNILGLNINEEQNYKTALEKTDVDLASEDNTRRFFAYFNRGSILVKMQDYSNAAQAYDRAFEIYPSIPEKTRPWRVMWYQTGPYFAYYYMGRYDDVINLANITLDAMSEPILEESYYWRAQSKWAIGDANGAIEDFKMSLKYHPNFGPTIESINNLGISLK